MNILYIVTGIAPPAGWGTEFIQNLIFSLSKKEVNATIITPIFIHTPKKFFDWKKKVEKEYSIKIIVVKLPKIISKNLTLQLYLSPIFITLKVISVLRKEKYDLIHEFTSTPIILIRGFLIKVIFNIPSTITLSVYNKTLLGSIKWFKFINTGKFYLIPAKKIIESLIKIGVNPTKIIFSPPGINLVRYQEINKLNSRKKLNLPLNKTIITYYGTITKEKGIEDIIKLSKDLSDNPNIVIALFTVWRGTEESQYQQYLNKANIIFRKEFVDINLVLSASDILIFPQLTGHGTVIPPISIIEAAVTGKPVLAKSTPGVSDILPKNNIYTTDLTKKVNECIKSPSSFKVNKSTLKMYNLEDSVNLHLEIYSKVMHES